MADQNHNLNSSVGPTSSSSTTTTEAHHHQQVQAATELAALQQEQLRHATLEDERRKADARKLLEARRRAQQQQQQQQQQAATNGNSFVLADDNGGHGTSCLARTTTTSTTTAATAAMAANHTSTIHNKFNSIYALTEHGLLRALNGGGLAGHATVHHAVGVPCSATAPATATTTTEDPWTAGAGATSNVFQQSAASMAATNSPLSSSSNNNSNNNNTNNFELDNALSNLFQRAQQQHSNSMRQLEELQALRTLQQQGFGASAATASSSAGGYQQQHHRLPFLTNNSSDLSSLLAAAAPNHHHHAAAFAPSHHSAIPLGDCLDTLRLRASLLGASLRPEDFHNNNAFYLHPEQQQQQQHQSLEFGLGATTPQEAVALYASYQRAAAAAANHRDQGPAASVFSAAAPPAAAAAPAPSLFASLASTENTIAAPPTAATATTVANQSLLMMDPSRNLVAAEGVAATAPQDQGGSSKKKAATPRKKNAKSTATKSSASKKQPPQEKAAAAAHSQDDLQDDNEDEEFPIPDLPAVRPLPPLEEGDTPHYSQRTCVVPLATEEDANWLSERQVFIRAELLEVVRASHQDVLVRSSSKSVAYQQVGIRCKYCAHLHPSARAIRSSAYPSSIRQMYQSFTMMVRDHWAGCTALPPKLKRRFLNYQEHKIPSSSLSREYWAFAAEKIGMVNNTEHGGGITITPESMQAALSMPSFGTTPEHVRAMQDAGRQSEPLVTLQEATLMSPFLHLLLSQAEVCYLLESERVGKRKDAPVGLSGFGCRHCIAQGRLGFCRVFPLNKRSLPTKVNDLYNHSQRCTLTPAATRALLRQYKRDVNGNNNNKKAGGKNTTTTTNNSHFAERDREYIDQIWTKLGRKGAQI